MTGMTATSAERSKARRLRLRAAQGELSPHDRAWLDSYEARHGGTRPERAPARPAEPAQLVSIEPLFAASPPPELDDDDDDDGFSEDERRGDETEATSGAIVAAADDQGAELETTGGHCNIGPDCPECAKAQRGGAQRCEATGRMAWPPMTPLQARAQAAVALGATGVVTRIARRIIQGVTAAYVPPTDEERAEMAEALDTIQRTHAGWLGWGAEFVALGKAMGGYAVRVYTAPALPAATATKPSTDTPKGDT